MRRLGYARAAVRDLRDISRYIARESASVDTARAFINRLQSKCQRGAKFESSIGRARPDLGPEIRSIAVNNDLVLVRYRHDTLEILRIVEGHRDFTRIRIP